MSAAPDIEGATPALDGSNDPSPPPPDAGNATPSLASMGLRPEIAALADQLIAEKASPGGPSRALGRVIKEQRGVMWAQTKESILAARIPGRFYYHEAELIPSVGDWVLVSLPARPGEDAWIDKVLPRNSQFSRKVAGAKTEQQVVAANVDTVFIVMGLDADFNLRRLERYLGAVNASGAQPVVILNKSDLGSSVPTTVARVKELAPEVPVLALSAKHGDPVSQLASLLLPGLTYALVGSSGAGKSTLVNALCGRQKAKTGAVRESDDRGQHTTSHRELIRLPGGALLIDNPGMRELQIWETDVELDEVFDDVAMLARQCRYRNCQHHEEPGCAIQQAIKGGELDLDRYNNYLRLGKEQEHLAGRQDQRVRLDTKKKWKAVHKAQRDYYKRRH